MLLVANHLWRDFQRTTSWSGPRLPNASSAALTFAVVTIAWVFFRADGFGAATRVFAGLFGLHGLTGGDRAALALIGPDFLRGAQSLVIVGVGAFFAIVFPNAHQIMGQRSPALGTISSRSGAITRLVTWRPTAAWAVGIGCVAVVVISVMFVRENAVEFIYFQF